MRRFWGAVTAVMSAAVMLGLAPQQSLADELRPASLSLMQTSENEWELGWKQPAVRPDERLTVPQWPANCEAREPVKMRRAASALLGHVRLQCEGEIAGQTLSAGDLVVSGDALLRVALLGRPVQTFRLTADQPSAQIAAKPEAWQVWRSYFALGLEHILEGWDHLLFVIALVLIVGGGWAVIKAATAFTIAHSITLGLVTLGAAGLPQKPVEAVIALSIVFLAVELARKSRGTLTRNWPWLVAFAFGLLHGFGFAGALREIGLPEGEVAAALISFNLGVEAGQLLVIAVLLAGRWLLARIKPEWDAPAVHAAAYGIGTIGSFWLIERVFSL